MCVPAVMIVGDTETGLKSGVRSLKTFCYSESGKEGETPVMHVSASIDDLYISRPQLRRIVLAQERG